MIRVFLSVVLVGAGLVLAGLTIQACGDAGAQEEESTQLAPLVDPEAVGYKQPTHRYTEILEELKRAASAGRNYDAPRLARGLGPVEKAAVKWFCQTAWQMVVNTELDKLPDAEYLSHRLYVRTILEVSNHLYTKSGRAPYDAPVEVGVDELGRVINLRSFDAKQDRRYKKSCYGTWKPA